MTQTEQMTYFENFTNEQLIDIAEQLNSKNFPEESIIRVISKKIFDNDSLTSIFGIGIP
jgi:hypothetical protein